MNNIQLIECVPNFSEGRDMNIIKQITNEIESVEGVRLIDVDPGKATNRTVITFVGNPEAVIEAAYKVIKKASKLTSRTKQLAVNLMTSCRAPTSWSKISRRVP